VTKVDSDNKKTDISLKFMNTKSIFSSNPPGVAEKLASKRIFIAGAGGLGSNIAVMLVRAGAENLAICDFDSVSETNLNRQNFFLDQVGQMKVNALKDNLLKINPNIKVEPVKAKLSIANFAKIITDPVDIVFECFDDAIAKSEVFSYCIRERPTTPLVMVSGLAGIGSSEEIKIKKIKSNVWLVGDGETEANPANGTLSSRVMLVASMQAHLGIRILLGLEN